jgi:hypothetical protein
LGGPTFALDQVDLIGNRFSRLSRPAGILYTFQMAEVAVSRQMFQDILSLIVGLRAPPATA